MAPRTINQRIVLQGGDDIERQFAEIARAAEQAFRQIEQAASNLRTDDIPTERLRQQLIQLGQAGQQAFQQLGQAGQTSASQITQASQEATTEVKAIGTAAQQSANQVGGVGQAATQSLAQVQTQATNTSAALNAVRAAVVGIGAAFVAAGVAAAGLAAAWTAMGKSASEAVLSIGRAADSAGVSINQFSRASPLLQQLGLSSDQAAAAIKRLAEATGGALKNALTSLEASGSRFNRAMLDTDKGRAALSTMMQGLSSIAVNGRSMFDDTTRAVLQFGLAFNPVTGQARGTTEALTELANRLEGIRDPAKRAQVVTSLFGADLAKVLLPALERGTAEFVNTIGQIDRLRLGMDNVDKEVAQKFTRSWDLLEGVLKANNRELGLLVAKPLTPFIERFAEAMRRSPETFKLYKETLEKIRPALDDLLKLIEGRSADIKMPWIQEAAKQLEGLGRAAKDVFFGVIVPALRTAGEAAAGLARAFNEAFGTDLKASVVAAGVAIGLLLGPIKAIGAALAAITLGEGPGFDKFREQLKNLGIDLEAVRSKAIEIWEDIKKLFSGDDVNVNNQWLLDIKNAIVEFKDEIGPAAIAAGAFAAAIVRIVGPANLARAAVLQITGAMDFLRNSALIVSAALVSVYTALGIIGRLATALAPVAAFFANLNPVVRAVAAAVAVAVVNFDKLLAAMEGFRALSDGDLNRATRAFEQMGIGAKQAQAGVEELRRALEQNPNMSGWEQAVRFAFGALKGEVAAILRDWERFKEELAGIGRFFQRLVQPFREVGVLIRAAWASTIASLQIQFNQFIEDLRQKLGIFGNLLPNTEPAERVLERLRERLSALRSEYDAIVAASRDAAGVVTDNATRIGAAFDAINTDQAQRELEELRLALDGIAQRTNSVGQQLHQLQQGRQVGTIGGELSAGAGVSPEGGGIFSGIRAAASAAVDQITATFQGIGAAIRQSLSSISVGDTFAALLAAARAAADGIVAAFSGIGQSLAGALRGAEQGVSDIMANVQNLVRDGFGALEQVITSVAAQVDAAIQRIIAALKEAQAQAQSLASAASGAGGGGGGAGFAAGGYTGSIGTSRIAGVVHGGEYVQPARVVRQPGVLAFMETLRRVGDLRRAIELFARGFSVGGLVDNFNARLSSLVVPQFAVGGLVPAVAGNGRVPDFGLVTVDFGQGRRTQIFTDEDSVRALRRISIQNQILSGGREPS